MLLLVELINGALVVIKLGGGGGSTAITALLDMHQ